MGHVPRVNQALMEIIVITHVPATVKATYVTFNMERVFSASLDGQGLYVAQNVKMVGTVTTVSTIV